MHSSAQPTEPDWERIGSVLLIRLRSIGDTVLMTPCLAALKSWRPELRVTVLIEELSAPLLQSHPDVDELIVIKRSPGQTANIISRLRLAHRLRRSNFDLVINLHGGTTASLLSRLTGAPYRAGFAYLPYSFLFNFPIPLPQDVWGKAEIHCAEQQLATLKWLGVPVDEPAATYLKTDQRAAVAVRERLKAANFNSDFALIHPAAAFETKRWPEERFAQIVDYLAEVYRLPSVLVADKTQSQVITGISYLAKARTLGFDNLSLAELMALTEMSAIFIGNDSGPAHIAAAYKRPMVVIFGSSNHRVWGPWKNPASELVRVDMPCAPCPGYSCEVFGKAECIRRLQTDAVKEAIDRVMFNVLRSTFYVRRSALNIEC